ncbi:unnamed protein product [Paramecium pentaurelia]|uniref:Uncharacterized protein n=1 Tax=Paramecium pentaurelia TaxID=43138 RepID=A0A8S1X6N5_9CILI|nr:unnamed protein product [Paramecium pentaurelia]
MSVQISSSNDYYGQSIPPQQVTPDQEILEALLSRKPFYESLFNSLVKMGLPVLSITPNQTLIDSINNGLFDIPQLQRLISIKLEGQPISYHRCKLAHFCKNFITECLNSNQQIELEHMLGLIKKTTQPITFAQIKRLDYTQLTYEQEFNYALFLKLLNINHVEPLSSNLTFNTTEITGYYEIKNIQDLRDHEQIETFIAVRKMRHQIYQIIHAIAEILDSLESLNITRIEDAFLKYINVKASLQFPFTKSINQEFIEKYISEDLITDESAQTFNKVSFVKSLNDNSKNQDQSTKKINKIPKEDNLLKSKRENKEYTKIKMKNDNLSKFMRKSTKNNMKKSHQELSLKWDQEKQSEFEKQISHLDQINVLNFSELLNQLFNDDISTKPKKPLQFIKRKVHFDVFDSCRYYNGKLIGYKQVNPRQPFHQYSFIEYELDSEEEIAEDVYSEERSVDMTSSDSLQEFIELDQKQSFVQNEEPFTLICDQTNFEQFQNYKAIILSDIIPIFEFDTKTNQNAKNLSKSVHLQNRNDQIIKVLENIMTPITNQCLQIQDTEFFIIPQSVEKQ